MLNENSRSIVEENLKGFINNTKQIEFKDASNYVKLIDLTKNYSPDL